MSQHKVAATFLVEADSSEEADENTSTILDHWIKNRAETLQYASVRGLPVVDIKLVSTAPVEEFKFGSIESITDAAEEVETLRSALLFGDVADNLKDTCPHAEQYLLLALSALEQARSFLRLAEFHEVREKKEAR